MQKFQALNHTGTRKYPQASPDRSFLISEGWSNTLSSMDGYRIIRKIAAFMLTLMLAAGVAPVAMAGTAMEDCCMSMAEMDMQASMVQDQQHIPMPDQQMPCMDMNGHCMMTSGSPMDLSQSGFALVLASQTAMPCWPAQAKLAGMRVQPDIPPPIAIL